MSLDINTPKCEDCGHLLSQHADKKERPCEVHSAYGYDMKTKKYAYEEDCLCARYVGYIPSTTGCPHECLEGSRTCVICGTVLPAKAKR